MRMLSCGVGYDDVAVQATARGPAAFNLYMPWFDNGGRKTVSATNGIVDAIYAIFLKAAIVAANTRRGTVIRFSTFGRRLFVRGSILIPIDSHWHRFLSVR